MKCLTLTGLPVLALLIAVTIVSGGSGALSQTGPPPASDPPRPRLETLEEPLPCVNSPEGGRVALTAALPRCSGVYNVVKSTKSFTEWIRVSINGVPHKNYFKLMQLGRTAWNEKVASKELTCSSNGSHLAYVAVPPGTSHFVAVLDGKEGKPYELIGRLVFSPDGKRLAYSARISSSPPKSCLVVDGRECPPFCSQIIDETLRFSPDSKRIAWVACTDEGQKLVLDGVEGKPWFSVSSPVFSPDSKHIAYIATPAEMGTQFVVLDGKPTQPAVEGVNMKFRSIKDKITPGILEGSLCFSPDSKQIAWVCASNIKGSIRMQAVVNGMPGKDYDRILRLSENLDSGAGYIRFSPDGKRFAYIVDKGFRGRYVVVDGQEQPRKCWSVKDLIFSPDSRSFAYADQGMGGNMVILNGRNVASGVLREGSLMFDPTSRHLAFTGDARQNRVRGKALYLDGKPGKVYPGVSNAVFSPDGLHFAYMAINNTTHQSWFVVDGIETGPYSDFVPGSDIVFEKSESVRTIISRNGKPFLLTVKINQ